MYKSSILIAAIFVTLSALAQPTNDNCINAEEIIVSTTSNTFIRFDINSAMINSEIICGTEQDIANVWYKFTMPIDGIIEISSDSFMNRFSLYDACSNTEIDCGGSEDALFHNLTSGNTYLLQVYRNSSTASEESYQYFSIKTLEYLTNDDCVNAEEISISTSTPTYIRYDPNAASINFERGCENEQDIVDAWYEFTMPVNGGIAITNGNTYSSFALYETCGGAEIECQAGQYNFLSNLTAGSTYLLRSFAPYYSPRTIDQTFSIETYEKLANDDCDGAEEIVITNEFQRLWTNASLFTSRTDQTICGITDLYSDFWYKFTLPVDGNVLVESSTFRAHLALYDACGDSAIQCAEDEKVAFKDLTAGNTYLLRVYRSNFNNDTSTSIQFKFIEKFNNTCTKAEEIVVSTTSPTNIENTFISPGFNETQPCSSSTYNLISTWYQFVMPIDANSISLSSDYSNSYAIYDDCGSVELDCQIDESVVFTGLIGGNTYFFRTYTRTNTSTPIYSVKNFTIQAFQKAANANCSDAEQIILTNSPTNISIDINTGTRSYRRNCLFDDIDPAAFVYYKFTMPVNGNVIVEGAEIDYSIYEYCSTARPISCGEGGVFIPNLIEGETYYLSPSVYPGAVGTNHNFTIRLIDAVDNDNCTNAETIPVINDTPTIVNFNVIGALRNDSIIPCVNPNGSVIADVWYEFNMPIDGNIVVDGGEANLNYFSLYDICGGPTINYCRSKRNKVLFSNLNAGSNYLLHVYRFNSDIQNVDHQSFSIKTVESVSNDDCINAQQITVTEDTPTIVSFNINDAARYFEDPICSQPTWFSESVADVWYEFTMPINGNMEVDGGSSINQFELYDTCNSTVIDCSWNSIIFTNLTAGNNYSLRVLRTRQHSFNENNQNFTITIGEFLSTDDHILENTISIYPNPANTILNISIKDNQSISDIELYNILGEKILKTKAKKINVSNFQPGIYIIRILTEKGRVTKRIVIQ